MVKEPEPALILLKNALKKPVTQPAGDGDGWEEETAVSSESPRAPPERKHPRFASQRKAKNNFSNLWHKN